MRRRIARNYPHPVATIGKPDRVEGIEAFGDTRPEQAPVLFAVSAHVNVEDEFVAVVVMSGPAHGDGGTIADSGRRAGGRILGVTDSALRGGEIDGDRLGLAGLLRRLIGSRARFDRN